MDGCPVVHIWSDDFGDAEIPPQLFEATAFNRRGLPDRRYTIQNAPFLQWLKEREAYWLGGK